MRIIAEDLAMGYTPPLQVLLMLDVPNRSKWRSTTDTLSPVMARIWLHRDDISFRFIPWFQSDFFPWWRVQFGPDSAGVGNAKTLGGTIPYERIRILRVREHTAWRISAAGKDDFAGFEIEWNRDGPIALPAIDPSRLCPLLWSADRDILSQGWSIPERDEKGPVRWTISPSARLTFPAACQGRSNLRVVVANAASTRDIADLSLRVNGQKVPYRRRSEDGNVIYDVDLSAKQISSSPILNIDFVVGGLDFLGGTTRKFGVAVRRVEIRTVNELSDGE
jgi:hypothetical protein